MSAAENTPIMVNSSASSSAKYAGTERRELSASCHEARITTGTRTAISATITRAMPSTSNVNRAPQNGIQAYDSRNWKRLPPEWKLKYITAVSTSTASDQPRASCLARLARLRGTTATVAAPTSGASVSTLRYGKSDIIRPYLRRDR